MAHFKCLASLIPKIMMAAQNFKVDYLTLTVPILGCYVVPRLMIRPSGRLRCHHSHITTSYSRFMETLCLYLVPFLRYIGLPCDVFVIIFSRFDRTPTRDGHRAIAKKALASRCKNVSMR